MKAIRFLNTLRNGLIQKKTLKCPLEQEKKIIPYYHFMHVTSVSES